jgi:hypothetical protein
MVGLFERDPVHEATLLQGTILVGDPGKDGGARSSVTECGRRRESEHGTGPRIVR